MLPAFINRTKRARTIPVSYTHLSLKLEFDLQSFREVKALRFDPLEGRPCLCRIMAPEARLIPENASGKEGDKDLFLTTDPSYLSLIHISQNSTRRSHSLRTG